MTSLPLRVAAVIPALNEERSLPLVLGDLPRDLVGRVIVADNGSTDATASVARAHGAEVVPEPRRGYGSACLAALAVLAHDPPDVVLFLDADYSDHPEEADRLLTPIAEDGYDMVVGSRVAGEREPGALPLQSRVGSLVAGFIIDRALGFRYTDLGPFRAIRYDALLRLGMRDRNYGWTVEMQIKALRHGLKVCEVPVSYRRRVGTSKITGTLSGTVKASAKILLTMARYTVWDR